MQHMKGNVCVLTAVFVLSSGLCCARSSHAATSIAPKFLTSNLNATGTVGVPFSLTVSLSGTEPITLTAMGHPPGLMFSTDPTGTHLLTGIPSSSGTFSGTATATNSTGTAMVPFTIVINPPTTSVLKAVITVVDGLKDTVQTVKSDGASDTEQVQTGTVGIIATMPLTAAQVSQVSASTEFMISIGDFSFDDTISDANKVVAGKSAMFFMTTQNDSGKNIKLGLVSLTYDAKKGLQLKIARKANDIIDDPETVLAGEFDGVTTGPISQTVNCYILFGTASAYFPVTLTGKVVTVNKNVGHGDNANQFQLSTVTLKGSVK